MLICTDGTPEFYIFFHNSMYIPFGTCFCYSTKIWLSSAMVLLFNKKMATPRPRFCYSKKNGHHPATVLLFNKNMAITRPRFCYSTKIWPLETSREFVMYSEFVSISSFPIHSNEVQTLELQVRDLSHYS